MRIAAAVLRGEPPVQAAPPPAALAQLPQRRVRYTSIFFHRRALQLWQICVVSLPLDLLLLLVHVRISPRLLELFTMLLALLTCGFIAREQVLDAADAVRTTIEYTRRSLKKYSWLGALFFFALAMAEMALKMGAQGVRSLGLIPILIAAIVLIIVATGAVRAIRKQMREQMQRLARLNSDRIYWVEQVNTQIFILSIIPIVGARVTAFLSILTLRGQPAPAWHPISYLILALLCLLAAYPYREHFVTQCRRCGFWTSRALKGLRFCPQCDMRAFQMIAVEEEQNEPGRVGKK